MNGGLPWSDGRRAALTLSFDNLGEATALQRGEWPDGEPLGRHFSVTRALPRILAALDEVGLRSTFFVEGVNTELYPDTLMELDARGHEVAYHGWCHEDWAGLDRDREAALLARGVRALSALGLRPIGLRPPGGRLSAASLDLLREHRFRYCSPAGSGLGVDRGVAVLPFEWRHVDAYHYLPRFAPLRERDRPAGFEQTLGRALERAVHVGSHLSVVFHPFLVDGKERFEVLRRHLQAVRALVDGGRLWCAPYRDVQTHLGPQAVQPLRLDTRAA